VLASPSTAWRTIGKVPYKVLDAPSLRDDFYLSLIDWGAKGILAVGLGNDVFLWNSKTAAVSRLMDIKDGVAAVSWSESGKLLAVSSCKGEVQVWDAEAEKMVSRHRAARDRVSTLAWANSVLAAGSRNTNITFQDISMRNQTFSLVRAHSSEVCGLRFSPDRATLASGGNDNKIRLWSLAGAVRDRNVIPQRSTRPLFTLEGHTSAVKALDWSPHRRGLLASGGGSMDKCIRFWDSLTGTCVGCVDTKCQVCNVRWSISREELVSSHGYSRNDMVVWKYPSMTRIATLQGHKTRVLFLTMDPTGENIVTGAGDETLRFWRVFPKMTPEQAAARPENQLPTATVTASSSSSSSLAAGAGAAAGTGDAGIPFQIAAAASPYGSISGETFR
jgi:cell division cycle 20-like protein 1 (cofactor of APC complex)